MDAWSTDEAKRLKELRISPYKTSPEKLRTLVQHFADNGTVWAVTEGDGPLKVSKDLARKVRNLTTSGDLAWVPDRSVPLSMSQGPTGETELGPHRRELFYFGIRLRDRLTLPRPDEIVRMDHLSSSEGLGLWMGAGTDESFRDPEEEGVEKKWGFEIYDARSHPVFDDFRQHLAQASRWESFDLLEEEFQTYVNMCGQTHEQIQSEIKLLLPDMASEDVIVMSMSLLANTYRPAPGGDWIEFDYTPVETDRGWTVQLGSWRLDGEAERGQLAVIIAAHRDLVGRSVRWETSRRLDNAQRSMLQSIDEFRESLEPNSILRKRIVRGKCENCA